MSNSDEDMEEASRPLQLLPYLSDSISPAVLELGSGIFTGDDSHGPVASDELVLSNNNPVVIFEDEPPFQIYEDPSEEDAADSEVDPNVTAVIGQDGSGTIIQGRITLGQSFVNRLNQAYDPYNGDWSELLVHLNQLPPPQKIELCPPWIAVRFFELPPSPWPFAVGEMPLRFVDATNVHELDMGVLGKAAIEIADINIRHGGVLTDLIFKEAVRILRGRGIDVLEIFCFDNFWAILLESPVPVSTLPFAFAGLVCYYRVATPPGPNPAIVDIPFGHNLQDDNFLDQSYDRAPLFPGVLLGSSIDTDPLSPTVLGTYKQTAAGILVEDANGKHYITVSTSGVGEDKLMWHPNPFSGDLVGKVVKVIPGTDISLMEIEPGISFINYIPRSDKISQGFLINGIRQVLSPTTRFYEGLYMDHMNSGCSEGNLIGIGLVYSEDTGKDIYHIWNAMESTRARPVGGRHHGTPIVGSDQAVLGLYYRELSEGRGIMAVAASELELYGLKFSIGLHEIEPMC